MLLLPLGQDANGLAEGILILLGQRLAVFNREVSMQVLIQRAVLFLDTFLLELRL